jgi:hypothetical protein
MAIDASETAGIFRSSGYFRAVQGAKEGPGNHPSTEMGKSFPAETK